MAKRYELSDEAWALVADLFTETHGRGRPRLSDRLMLDGVLWVLCSGAAWRDIRRATRFTPRAQTTPSPARSLQGSPCRSGCCVTARPARWPGDRARRRPPKNPDTSGLGRDSLSVCSGAWSGLHRMLFFYWTDHLSRRYSLSCLSSTALFSK
nr:MULTISPECIES: transposase [Pseudomonas]